MYHTQPLPVYITSSMAGGVKPTPVYAVNATSEWVTPAEFYAYTGGSESSPPAPAPTTYATISSVDFALATKADKTYVDTKLATKADNTTVNTLDAQNIKKGNGNVTNNLGIKSMAGSSIYFTIDTADTGGNANLIFGNTSSCIMTLGRSTLEGGQYNGTLRFGDNVELQTASGNSAKRLWTLPSTTSNVQFLHSSVNTLTSDPSFVRSSGSMEFSIKSAPSQYCRLIVGSNSIGTYLLLGETSSIAGGTRCGDIQFGGNVTLTTAPNTANRRWILPTTESTDIQFLHNGGDTQYKTGQLTLGQLKLGLSAPIIASIETTMPAVPADSQLLTAKAIKDAIGGGGGSYLPLAGGTMNVGSKIYWGNDATSRYVIESTNFGITNKGVWDTKGTDGFLYCSGFQTGSGYHGNQKVQFAANTPGQGPCVRGYDQNDVQKFLIEPLTTGGKLTIMDASGNIGIRLEGNTIVGNTFYSNISYGLGNATIRSMAQTAGTEWTFPNVAGSHEFASQSDLGYTLKTFGSNGLMETYISLNGVLMETRYLHTMRATTSKYLLIEGFRFYKAAGTYGSGALTLQFRLNGTVFFNISIYSQTRVEISNGPNAYSYIMKGNDDSSMKCYNWATEPITAFSADNTYSFVASFEPLFIKYIN